MAVLGLADHGFRLDHEHHVLDKQLRWHPQKHTLRALHAFPEVVEAAKISKIWQEIQDNINSESVSISVELIFLTTGIACSWYAIGVMGDDGSEEAASWVRQHNMLDKDIWYC
eukprot:CAMPEP_0115325382 /NCGR_PEP_ID=MMETSP0270-20121206/82984_1 /TAXON_ID=71861 /ORGANISM="Scrippsiella trochoidea, Strain CCMP3099" /LENGTH=112 /DNA_ID=CAMNT_0002745567 /DNA_START=89 /DNA_END=425 /DNA_ORIENTATION=+